jgi:hypothetical protein
MKTSIRTHEGRVAVDRRRPRYRQAIALALAERGAQLDLRSTWEEQAIKRLGEPCDVTNTRKTSGKFRRSEERNHVQQHINVAAS